MTVPETAPAISAPAQPVPRELDIFAFALMLLDNLRLIVGCALAGALLMAAFVLHQKPRFSSTAVMIVPQGNIKTSLLESQLAANTSDLLGGGYELYSDILRSRTVAERLIRDNDLVKTYHAKNIEDAELALAALTKVRTLPEGVLLVSVQDTDPQRAANIANDYLHQLDLLNSQLVLSSIGQERAYLEREMIKEKDALADAEVALKQVQESTSGVAPDSEASGALSALETTRAQLRAAQVRLGALLQSETESNPDVQRTHAEINTLAAQLNALEHGTASVETGTPTSRVPEEALVYTRRLREVKFHETLFDLLEKQFEGAKQQEAKTPSIVQVLDPAIPALHKSWPPRTLYTLVGGVIGFIAGIFLVILRAFIFSYLGVDKNSKKLQQIKRVSLRQIGIKL
jgi:capsular polysaccharide biosynthesis protein